MDLIEQAAKRLEQLRRAGAEADAPYAAPAAEPPDGSPRVPTPEAAVHRLDENLTVLSRNPGAAPALDHAPVAPPPPVQHTHGPRFDLDLERMKRQGMITPDAPRSRIADEFRVIKRPLVSNASGRSGAKIAYGNLLMVTSSLPGEGKTFTAINLALSIAMEVGTTVLLVDGDVAHPDLPKRLGIRNSPGLLDLLTRDDLDVGDVLMRTNVDNLTIMPAGSHHRRATELLASEQMAMLLRELASRYPDRIVVFDSPPLLATTEARVLASHMGQIVMVVAADSTRQQAVNLALSTIESCDVVMMVLNKADKTDVGTYYGYYGDEAGER